MFLTTQKAFGIAMVGFLLLPVTSWAAASAVVDDPQACSETWDTAIKVEFRNLSGGDITVDWINYDCAEVRYHTLHPGQAVVQYTYASHPWQIRSSDGDHLKTLVPFADLTYTYMDRASDLVASGGGCQQSDPSPALALIETTNDVIFDLDYPNLGVNGGSGAAARRQFCQIALAATLIQQTTIAAEPLQLIRGAVRAEALDPQVNAGGLFYQTNGELAFNWQGAQADFRPASNATLTIDPRQTLNLKTSLRTARGTGESGLPLQAIYHFVR